MATSQGSAENFMKAEDNMTEHVDSIQRSLEKLLSFSAGNTAEAGLLRSRIDEQSDLIWLLKERADDLLLRCQALQKINTELEERVINCQKQLDEKRENAEILEKRFMHLADNNQAIIAFMDEYKNQNAQLKVENKQLQAENDTLFSQKLQDKEMLVQKLLQEMKQLTETCTNKEKKYREKLTGCQSKLLEQATQHQAREASLLDQLHDAQEQHRQAMEVCKGQKLKLQHAEKEQALKELNLSEIIVSLTDEKDKLLSLSMERGRAIQEKQEEMQQLETKWKGEKKARSEAEERFAQEAEAVNADVKVKSLQSALDDSKAKYEELKKDFEAFKEHSGNLLTQERALNKKLRHMIG